MIGETLTHYKILDKIGEGGMGEVYVAEDTKLKRQVALKLLPESMAADEERLQRFQREAEAIAALNHPNIVTIFSVEEDQGHHFLTMELVEGVNLGDKVPAQGMKLEEIFAVAIPTAKALAAAHEKGVVHRDLKPANIMVSDDERVKILDFGLAKLAEGFVGSGSSTQMATDSITQEGRILGTVAYMSPEQAEGKTIDARSDVFSLGVVLYQMATGEQPFKGDTNLSTLSSILKDSPDSVTDLRINLPRHLGRIITHCLEKDPKRRYQSAQDVVNELSALKREIESGKTPSDLSLPAVEAPKSRPRWMPIAIGAGLVVIALVGWLALRGGGSETPGDATTASSQTTETTGEPALPGIGTSSDRVMTVVLPFENLGTPEDAYFAAGMTEEITDRLSSVESLGVISRQSAKRYADTDKTPKEIGAELGVDYILGGTVRWARNPAGESRIRISPRLVRVADDTQVWSESYDRVIDDIFSIQSEIAQNVMTELGVNLLDTERQSLAAAPTEDAEAYQAYLKGIESFHDISLSDRHEVAARLFERAVELDPEFAWAWARLSWVKSNHHFNAGEDPNLLPDAKRALDRAVDLAPEGPHVRLAVGYYHYYALRDFDRALEEFEAVTAASPNDAEVTASIGWIYRRQGRLEEFVRQFERALVLDPQNQEYLHGLAQGYRALRRFEEAHQTIDRAIFLAPDNAGLYQTKAWWTIFELGSTSEAREILSAAPVTDPMSGTWYTIEYWDRNFEKALEIAETIPVEGPLDEIAAQGRNGEIFLALGRREEGIAELEAAARELETVIASRPDNSPGLHRWLAELYALTGGKDEAIREARQAFERVGDDRWSAPSFEDFLAYVFALTGEVEASLEILDRNLSSAYVDSMTIQILRWCPWPALEFLRDDPRYQEWLRKHE